MTYDERISALPEQFQKHILRMIEGAEREARAQAQEKSPELKAKFEAHKAAALAKKAEKEAKQPK
jgi:hypothetical protein